MTDTVLAVLDLMSPAQWCQTFFLLATGSIIAIQALPRDVRKALMEYGARKPANGSVSTSKGHTSALQALADTVTSYGQVPHQWFLHFYVLSTGLSLFWAWQFISRGSIMRTLAEWQQRAQGPSMSLEQVIVAWLLMALQGVRRLYESLFVSRPGKSPMWIVHWVLALVYYTTMSVSVWIHGSNAILEFWAEPQPYPLPGFTMLPALVLYSVACYEQNRSHRHLASLKKYTLPSEGAFQYIVCAHYTFECLLYLAIAWVAAPPGSVLNGTVLCGLLFVAVNLGSTANGTKKWYAEKFGADSVAQRWKMIPFLF